MKLLIKNGTLITATSTIVSDILLDDGKIEQVKSVIQESHSDKVINANGLYIFPGGVDPHVHMHLPSGAGYSSDDFITGSRAALFGGTTTLLDFVTPVRGQSLTEALEYRKKEAEESLADYSFHVSPVEWRETTEDEIIECINMGCKSFKVYMAYKSTIGLSDIDFLKVLQVVGKAGGIVTVHCELGDVIERFRENLISENKTSPFYHPLSRPAILESSAVKRAIELAKEACCTLYIVHVSAGESLMNIREAHNSGQKVIAETCPQYLLLDDSKYQGCFENTSPFVISPPLRKKEDSDALWEAISDGTINTIGTDHCPFNALQKAAGSDDFRKIPNGAGGVEHRLPLLYTYGVLEKKISLNKMVDLFSTQPAKVFGLYPRKGEIAVGSDADLVLWNPDTNNTISAKTHHQCCDVNIYEGIRTTGSAEYVIFKGKIVIQNGVLIDPDIRGDFLKR